LDVWRRLANLSSGILQTAMGGTAARRVASFERKRLADDGPSEGGGGRGTRCSGLKWASVGTAKPDPGAVLSNRVLEEVCDDS
jgi:hypothetical protein